MRGFGVFEHCAVLIENTKNDNLLCFARLPIHNMLAMLYM